MRSAAEAATGMKVSVMARAADFNVRIIGRVMVSVIFSLPAKMDPAGARRPVLEKSLRPGFQLDGFGSHDASDVQCD